MADWSGQDWAYAFGGAAVLLTGLGGFITSMVTLRRVGQVAQKVDGILAQRDAQNIAAGAVIGRQAGDDASAQRAEGRREQREIQTHRDAAAAALGTHPDGAPVPVKDDQVAEIAKRSMEATQSIAESAKEANILAKKE